MSANASGIERFSAYFSPGLGQRLGIERPLDHAKVVAVSRGLFGGDGPRIKSPNA
jgi:hypothetical protein